MPALAADARGVDEDEGVVATFEDSVDRVTGRARRLRDDHAVVPEDRVQQRRLTDVRPPEDRDADCVVGSLLTPGTGKLLDDLVEEIAAAVPVQRGDGPWVAEAQAVQVESEALLRGIVDLVRDQQHGLARAPEDVRDL